MRVLSRWIGHAVLSLAVTSAAPAIAFEPSERIVLVSQSSPGTGNDLMLRKLAEIWTKNKVVGQTVSNENVTGALGENARRYMVEGNAGNEHVLFAYSGSTLNQTILSGSAFMPDRFTPIVMLVTSPAIVVVNASSPYQTLDDLIADAKEKPGTVIQGGGPYGGPSAMVGQALQDKAGVQLPYTPFKGGGEAVTQLLGGHVGFIIENPGEVNQYLASGQMRVLATTTKLPTMPEVKTLDELGYGIEVPDSFRAIFAPPGISQEARDYYVDLFRKTRDSEDWQKFIADDGLVDFWMESDETAKYVSDAIPLYKSLDEKMGLLKK